jgi:hypothetical protein
VESVVPPVDAHFDHHILLCARQYAVTLRKLRAERDADERECQTRMLHFLIETGTSEFKAEQCRRMGPLASEIHEWFERPKRPPLGRPVTRKEAELIRHACAIPPVARRARVTSVRPQSRNTVQTQHSIRRDDHRGAAPEPRWPTNPSSRMHNVAAPPQ